MSQQNRPRRVLATTGVAAALVLGAGATAQAAPAASTSSVSSTLAKIRYCESGNNYQAQNASSTASGAYQFLDSTWRGLSAAKGYSRAKYAPASVQDAAARELYAQAGTSPWASSQSCWSRLGAVPSTASSTSTTSTTSSTSSTASTSTSRTSRSAQRTQVPATERAGRHARPAQPTQDAKTKPQPQHKGHRHVGKHRAAPAPR